MPNGVVNVLFQALQCYQRIDSADEFPLRAMTFYFLSAKRPTFDGLAIHCTTHFPELNSGAWYVSVVRIGMGFYRQNVPYLVLIAARSATLTSFGPVRTSLPCFLTKLIISRCMSPRHEWMISPKCEAAARKRPGIRPSAPPYT